MITPNEFAARTPLDRSRERELSQRRKGRRSRRRKRRATIRDADHARNFLDCVRSRQTPSCDIEFGHRCTTAALIGNIAHKTKSLWSGTKRPSNSSATQPQTNCCGTITGHLISSRVERDGSGRHLSSRHQAKQGDLRPNVETDAERVAQGAVDVEPAAVE